MKNKANWKKEGKWDKSNNIRLVFNTTTVLIFERELKRALNGKVIKKKSGTGNRGKKWS